MIADEILSFAKARLGDLRAELSADPRFVAYEDYAALIRRLETAGVDATATLAEALRPDGSGRLAAAAEAPALDAAGHAPPAGAGRAGRGDAAPAVLPMAIGVRSQEGQALLRVILAEANGPLSRRDMMEELRLRGYEPAGQDPLSEITKACHRMADVENPGRLGYRLCRPAAPRPMVRGKS